MTTTTVTWIGWPHAPAPLAAIVQARRATGSVRVVNDAGSELTFGALRFTIEAIRGLWLRALDLILGAGIVLLTSRRSPAVRRGRPGDGPVVLVMPMLPDISHTFVYREVLAIRRTRPDWQLLVLEHNQQAPVHSEAGELLPQVAFMPREGITARTLRALCWLLRRPGRDLFALYRAEPGGSARALLGKNPLRTARHPGNAFLLAKQLQRLRPRHLHVYSSTYATNVVMGAAHLLDLPFSISSYVDFEFAYDHKMLVEKLVRARFCRVISRYDAARLREQPGVPELADERVPVVDFGLEVEQWSETATPPRQGVLVSAARLVPKKGFHLVPPMLAALRARGVDFRWRLIGDGPEQDALEAACRDHDVADAVDFLGACDNATVRAELLRSDLALLPCVLTADGERDGIPIFLVEAMALGVPVVTTPIAGIPELVRDEDTGFLCASEDIAALTDRVVAVLQNPEHAAQVAQRGRAAACSKFDVRTTSALLTARIESELCKV